MAAKTKANGKALANRVAVIEAPRRVETDEAFDPADAPGIEKAYKIVMTNGVEVIRSDDGDFFDVYPGGGMSVVTFECARDAVLFARQV